MTAFSFSGSGLIAACLFVAEIPLCIIIARYDPSGAVHSLRLSTRLRPTTANLTPDRLEEGCERRYTEATQLINFFGSQLGLFLLEVQQTLKHVNSSLGLPNDWTSRNPPPALFAISWLLFGLFAVIFHQEHSKDRHQNHMLYLGVICCAVDAFAFKTCHPLKEMGRYLPIYIWCATALSAFFHRYIFRHRDDFVDPLDNEMKNEKTMAGSLDSVTADGEAGLEI